MLRHTSFALTPLAALQLSCLALLRCDSATIDDAPANSPHLIPCSHMFCSLSVRLLILHFTQHRHNAKAMLSMRPTAHPLHHTISTYGSAFSYLPHHHNLVYTQSYTYICGALHSMPPSPKCQALQVLNIAHLFAGSFPTPIPYSCCDITLYIPRQY